MMMKIFPWIRGIQLLPRTNLAPPSETCKDKEVPTLPRGSAEAHADHRTFLRARHSPLRAIPWFGQDCSEP